MQMYTPTPDFYNDYIAHHGVQGMKWGVRRYQNEDGSLTEAGKKRYHVETGRFGKTRIVDQYGKKMKRRDKKYMEKSMRTKLKTNDPEAYKEYKKSKIQSNMHRTYKGDETLLSKHSSRKGQAEVNKLVADYANKTLSDLQKKGRSSKKVDDRPTNTYLIAGNKIKIPVDATDAEARWIVWKATKGGVTFNKSKGTYKFI